MIVKPFLISALVFALAAPTNAWTQRRPPQRNDIAATVLKDATGAERGTAALYQRGQEVRVEVVFEGTPGAVHGVHLHRIGQCISPDFASAGEHWNPYWETHGLALPHGGHAGDLPNLTVEADGVGRIDVLIDAIALTESDPPLENVGAIVVHADPDDLRTDPAGNSGARIACGALGDEPEGSTAR